MTHEHGPDGKSDCGKEPCEYSTKERHQGAPAGLVAEHEHQDKQRRRKCGKPQHQAGVANQVIGGVDAQFTEPRVRGH